MSSAVRCACTRTSRVRCADRSGFVVNALLVPYLLSAIRMVESGAATTEDVDKAVVAGLSHPMGPLRLDWKYLPRALPWFTRLLLNLRAEPFQKTVAGLRALRT